MPALASLRASRSARSSRTRTRWPAYSSSCSSTRSRRTRAAWLANRCPNQSVAGAARHRVRQRPLSAPQRAALARRAVGARMERRICRLHADPRGSRLDRPERSRSWPVFFLWEALRKRGLRPFGRATALVALVPLTWALANAAHDVGAIASHYGWAVVSEILVAGVRRGVRLAGPAGSARIRPAISGSEGGSRTSVSRQRSGARARTVARGRHLEPPGARTGAASSVLVPISTPAGSSGPSAPPWGLRGTT